MRKTHPAFEFLGEHNIQSLNLVVEHYQHKITGAAHYHLAAEDPQNVFLVALRTVPSDSTGVAHILEHTTLCGSEKYPVRDPFFMMIRRSLNTFMNAFTSSDWTAYPFATENKKDFQNLLQVYMDAVFFPNLDPLDFAQEGHRFEFEEKDNASSDLTYKGVVFNEMKGAMSSPVSRLWQAFSSELYPTNTYHYNSGGEPEDIPDLSYQQLVDFHREHYHPSNAVFMTYGDISAQDHQNQFESLALSRFDEQIPQIHVSLEQRLTAPKQVETVYALDEDDTTNKTHIVLGWLLGENKDPLEVLRGHLLSSVLLDNSASPLRNVLEATNLASAPSPLCGLEESNKEMAFVVGVQGSEATHADEIERLILTELQRIVDEGVDQAQVEAMLHQLELLQREVGGDSYPYGLQLILHALPGALHEGDPIQLLDTDSALEQLEDEVKNPAFIPDLVRTWLLDNPHRIRLVMKPDTALSAQQATEEKAKLAAIKATLSDAQKTEIIEQSIALEQRQGQEDDPSILPEVTKDDIPQTIKQYSSSQASVAGMNATTYQCGSNGLTYAQMIVDLPVLSDEQKALLPLFNSCVPEVGSAGRDYMATQALQAQVTGGLSARSAVHSKLGAPNDAYSHFMVSSKALNRNQSEMGGLMAETLYQARFDEASRLRDLVGQIRSSVDHGVTGNGHGLAMMAATQNFTPAAQWSFQRSGFAGIQYIKQLHNQVVEDDVALERFTDGLSSIQSALLSANKQVLLISDEPGMQETVSRFNQVWRPFATHDMVSQSGLSVTHSKEMVKQAWLTSTQVNFCALAFPAVMADHADAPKLAVLGACLRNGYLHSVIREKGGAYGGGATYNPENSAFVFYSYRDPRLLETYQDFLRAYDWLMGSEATQSKVDEAILNVISSMDKPGSPAGERKKAFFQQLYGRTHEVRMAYRHGVISTTLAELREVAGRYLTGSEYSQAVLTNPQNKSMLEAEGFSIHTL